MPGVLVDSDGCSPWTEALVAKVRVRLSGPTRNSGGRKSIQNHQWTTSSFRLYESRCRDRFNPDDHADNAQVSSNSRPRPIQQRSTDSTCSRPRYQIQDVSRPQLHPMFLFSLSRCFGQDHRVIRSCGSHSFANPLLERTARGYSSDVRLLECQLHFTRLFPGHNSSSASGSLGFYFRGGLVCFSGLGLHMNAATSRLHSNQLSPFTYETRRISPLPTHGSYRHLSSSGVLQRWHHAQPSCGWTIRCI